MHMSHKVSLAFVSLCPRETWGEVEVSSSDLGPVWQCVIYLLSLLVLNVSKRTKQMLSCGHLLTFFRPCH